MLIAPPFEVAHVPAVLERPLVNLGAHVPNVSRRSATDSGRPDRDPGFATHGLAQVLRLGMAVRRDAVRDAPVGTEILFLVNAHDGTVKSAPVLDLAHTWNRLSVPVSVFEFPDSLGLPHNVVDPMNRATNAQVVYATLIALAHGDRPPHAVTTRRVTRRRRRQPDGHARCTFAGDSASSDAAVRGRCESPPARSNTSCRAA